MSNTESRTCGIVQRALALFMALVLAVSLTPGFAVAEEANNADAVAEQSATADTDNESEATAESDSASKADAAASANKKAEAANVSADTEAKAPAASSESNAAGADASKSTDQANSTPVATNNSKPAEQADSTNTETVSATLKISIYGTVLVSHTFDIEKGKTVEDMLNLAKAQGYIDDYSHGEPYPGYTSYYVSSITIKGKAYTQPADYSEYWSSTINGKWESNGINGSIIDNNGFSYELNYASNNPDAKYDNGTGDYAINPDAGHPDKASGNDTTAVIDSDGNASTVTSAPTTSSNATLSWKKTYGSGNYSEILSIGGFTYFAASLYNADWSTQTAVLYRLDAKGKETASLQLFGTIDTTCRMVYTDGVIVIPLSNGRLQGVSASEMKTMWVSDAIASGAQNISTVTAANGMVFTGTANSLDNSWNAASGTFFGINAITGERVWANEETDTGFYWAGACKVGSVLLYGNDAGVLTAVDPATGKTVSTLKLSSAIRSTVIANNAGNTAYVTTNDGTLHKIAVAADGSLSESNTASFCAKSTSTATLFEGNLFVGGGTSDWKGCLSVIDAATMQVKKTVTLPFEVKSTPLVAKAADGRTYAYFTCNGAEGDYPEYTSGGGAWVYCLETNTVAKLFDATGSMANYCTKSITMGADGTLYWTNDSGTLFALANAASHKGDDGKDDNNGKSNTEPEPKKDNGNKKTNSSSGHAPAASPISNASSSAAAETPLSSESDEADGDASAEDADFGVEPTSAATERSVSANNDTSENEQQIPWLPIAGIVVGCAGLVGVGIYLFRRRSL